MNKQKIAVVLLSGGLDSTTVATLAKSQGYDISAITFNYGQVLSKEIKSAQETSKRLGITHKIIDISNYKDLAWYSALTHPEMFSVPKERSINEMSDSIPITYVPLRNTFLIVMAAALLESQILEKVELEKVDPQLIEARIFIAANALDYSGYPDCRPEYYQRLNELMKITSKVGIQYKIEMKIETPLLYMTKKEIAELGLKLKAPLDQTWSCYVGGEIPCQKCDSCKLRAQGFKELGVSDPLIARLQKEGKM
ncbi:MAG: 7-cyano-7-deazaguanine synthase QueC [Candidatus Bathyarchaeota archaeon]|nr:7-cyano-7-deazaguanine synthase QueC [Candidatus Bathyarchaeota archaeon]